MKTIRVRIRVCVDERGNYNAAGYGGPNTESGPGDDWIRDGMPGGAQESWHWITAEVTLPESREIEGRVE